MKEFSSYNFVLNICSYTQLGYMFHTKLVSFNIGSTLKCNTSGTHENVNFADNFCLSAFLCQWYFSAVKLFLVRMYRSQMMSHF